MIKARKVRKKGTRYKFIICFITGLMWGAIMGSVGISILVSYRMDGFYEKIAYLENTIRDREEKLEKLEKSINTANIVLKDIYVKLEFVNMSEEQIDHMDSIEIEKTIKEKFSSSLGKEIKDLDADILVEVVDKRILRLDNSDYQLRVNKLVLSDILKLWIEVSSMEVAS